MALAAHSTSTRRKPRPAARKPKSSQPAPGSRDRLFAAAAAEFAARGFAGANVDRIARAAGVNKAMIYYHFHSKAALYQEILPEMFHAVGERIRSKYGIEHVTVQPEAPAGSLQIVPVERLTKRLSD